MKKVLILLGLCLAFQVHADDETGALSDAEIKAYYTRLTASNDATEQSLGMLFLADPADPSVLAEAGRRWALSEPGPEAVKLTAAIACAWKSGTQQRELCYTHQLLQRWQQLESRNALVWALAAVRADEQGDQIAFQRSEARLLESERFDTAYVAALSALKSSMSNDPAMSAQTPGERAIVAFGSAAAIALPSYADIHRLCPRGEQPIRLDRSMLCRHLAKLMIENSFEMVSALVGNNIARAYAADEQERAAFAEAEARDKALHERFSAHPTITFRANDARLPEAYGPYLQLVIEHGEREAMIRWLASQEPSSEGGEGAQ